MSLYLPKRKSFLSHSWAPSQPPAWPLHSYFLQPTRTHPLHCTEQSWHTYGRNWLEYLQRFLQTVPLHWDPLTHLHHQQSTKDAVLGMQKWAVLRATFASKLFWHFTSPNGKVALKKKLRISAYRTRKVFFRGRMLSVYNSQWSPRLHCESKWSGSLWMMQCTASNFTQLQLGGSGVGVPCLGLSFYKGNLKLYATLRSCVMKNSRFPELFLCSGKFLNWRNVLK